MREPRTAAFHVPITRHEPNFASQPSAMRIAGFPDAAEHVDPCRRSGLSPTVGDGHHCRDLACARPRRCSAVSFPRRQSLTRNQLASCGLTACDRPVAASTEARLRLFNRSADARPVGRRRGYTLIPGRRWPGHGCELRATDPRALSVNERVDVVWRSRCPSVHALPCPRRSRRGSDGRQSLPESHQSLRVRQRKPSARPEGPLLLMLSAPACHL